MSHSLLFLLGMVVFFSVFLTVVFRLEKRMVWPYGDLESSPFFGDPTGYGARWVEAAARSGFSLLGWSRDAKGPAYRCSYAMLISADRGTFGVVGVGTIFGIPLAATWLHTPSSDGRSYCSTDNQKGVQIDLSRNWMNQFAPTFAFSDLLQKHYEWLGTMSVRPRYFSRGSEFAEFRALREQHFRSMERAGLIRFTDLSATHFHFTFLGAAKTAIWSYFLGMARQLSGGRFPRTA